MGNHSPPAKRQKLECIATTSGSPSSSNKVCNRDENCLPFLLTSVRGIGPEFNARNTAIGIEGMCSVFYRALDLCTYLICQRILIIFSVFTLVKKSAPCFCHLFQWFVFSWRIPGNPNISSCTIYLYNKLNSIHISIIGRYL